MYEITFKIIFSVLLFIIFIITTAVIFSKKHSLLLTDTQWCELFIGTILVGIYLGIIRSNILGYSNGNDMFFLLGTFYLLWYLLTKLFSNSFTIQTPLYESKENNLILTSK